MKQNKIELKLLKILDLLYDEKINILDDKKILYSNIHKISSIVEVIYDTIRTSKGRDFTPKGVILPVNKIGTGVEQ
tara:strand:+ start:163 stop:390 length:228 start_codon:yes stop_codon:yes gene_type:complete